VLSWGWVPMSPGVKAILGLYPPEFRGSVSYAVRAPELSMGRNIGPDLHGARSSHPPIPCALGRPLLGLWL
jgi:hypothetical protein